MAINCHSWLLIIINGYRISINGRALWGVLLGYNGHEITILILILNIGNVRELWESDIYDRGCTGASSGVGSRVAAITACERAPTSMLAPALTLASMLPLATIMTWDTTKPKAERVAILNQAWNLRDSMKCHGVPWNSMRFDFHSQSTVRKWVF